MASDTEYGDGDADEENDEDNDQRSRESSPCLSSEASFFLDTDASKAAAKAAIAARSRDHHQDQQLNQRTHLLQQYPRPTPQSPFARQLSLRHEAQSPNSNRGMDRKAERVSKTVAKRPNKFE